MSKKITFRLFLLIAAIFIMWVIIDFRLSKSEFTLNYFNTPIPTFTSSPILPTNTTIPDSTNTLVPPTPTPTEIPPPLSDEAIKNCPVSLPNGRSLPYPYQNLEFNHGNDEGTIFTILPDDGKWIFEPDGPGRIWEDGSLGIKWPWLRTVEGDVRITGHRLDAIAPPMPEEILHGKEDGYEETGFQPSGLIFPSEGCWEVTATVGEEDLSFVLLVINNG